MREPLTESQQRIYIFLVSFIREHGYSPTIREIQKQFSYNSSNSVVSQLTKLEKKGYVTKSSTRDGARARTLRLVDDIIGVHTVDSAQLKKALKNLVKKKYYISLNETVELLSELNIRIV